MEYFFKSALAENSKPMRYKLPRKKKKSLKKANKERDFKFTEGQHFIPKGDSSNLIEKVAQFHKKVSDKLNEN